MVGCRSLAAIVLLVVLSCGMRYGAGGTYLQIGEMRESRGGSAQQKICTWSCNAATGHINLCPTVGPACSVCSLGANTVNYTDMAGPSCGAGGYTTSGTRVQDCGVLQLGSCTAIGVCGNLVNQEFNCDEPPVVCPQGNCP
jgi:hypothetical protein